MDHLLVETSVWIDCFKGQRNRQTDLLNRYLEEDNPVFICPLIIQEILQGIRSDDE